MIQVRKMTEADLEEAGKTFIAGRTFMRRNGNHVQWINGYPSETDAKNDIENGNGYVIEEKGEILAVFAMIPGEEATYRYIEGRWSSDMPYCTIHRLASNGKRPHIADICFDFCKTQCAYLRVDTHEDNIVMQNAILRNDFKKCGTIYLTDGSPRIAFDYISKG